MLGAVCKDLEIKNKKKKQLSNGRGQQMINCWPVCVYVACVILRQLLPFVNRIVILLISILISLSSSAACSQIDLSIMHALSRYPQFEILW